MTTTIIAIYSDPNSGSEEALGRVFNALVLAYELKEKGEPYELIFQGTGTRWPAKLNQEDHMLHALYKTVKDDITGVSCGCADVFGAAEEVKKNTALTLIKDAAVPGTTGLVDMARYIKNGDRFIVF